MVRSRVPLELEWWGTPFVLEETPPMSRVRTLLLALLSMALVAALVQPAAADPSVVLPGLVSSNPVTASPRTSSTAANRMV